MALVLVTGGAGYVGSHTVRELLRTGHEVIVYDNLVTGHRQAVLPPARLVHGDLSNREQLDVLFRTYQFDSVLHFAAFSLVGESVSNPSKYYQNNVLGALSLLDVMLAHGVRQLVFSSTAAVYGNPVTIPIPETDPIRPVNPYGESKVMVERILESYHQAYGLRYASLRYFNAAGADASGLLGEDHNPESHLIPLVLQVALGHRESIKVFGTDYDTPDGTCIRDYIHVSDLAAAHLLALQALSSGSAGAFNLGVGTGHSVLEVIQTAERVTGRTIPWVPGQRRPGDPPVLVASAERARQVLGWQPVRSDLVSILESAWRWHSQNPQGYRDKA